MKLRSVLALSVLLLSGGAWLATADAQPEPAAGQPPAGQPPAGQPPAGQPKAPKGPPAEAPEQPKAGPEPGAPKEKAPEGRPGGRPSPDVKAPGLPSWHPPVGEGQQGQPQRAPLTREQLEEMIRQNRLRQGQPGLDLPPSSPVQQIVKAPRDEHGFCMNDGPNDPPREINLFHGWLGVDNEKAIVAPPRFGGEAWWGQNKWFDLGNKEWWTWRLTPHPWRYENHTDHCDRRNQPLPLAASIVNLAVLLFILVRFGRRPITEALERRKRTIMTDIDKAQTIKKSAQKRLVRYENELENLDERLGALRAQYALEGEHEERRVREEAAEARERMLADAAFRISQEHKSARDELSRHALEDALRAAEEMLERAVTSSDHDRLEAEYLDQLDDALRGSPRSGGAS